MDKGIVEPMATKFQKIAISMLKNHRKMCRRGLAHLDATPTFKNRSKTYGSPCMYNRYALIFILLYTILPVKRYGGDCHLCDFTCTFYLISYKCKYCACCEVPRSAVIRTVGTGELQGQSTSTQYWISTFSHIFSDLLCDSDIDSICKHGLSTDHLPPLLFTQLLNIEWPLTYLCQDDVFDFNLHSSISTE